MGDWKKHVVPDWVFDDYNSRVFKDVRLPIIISHDEFNSISSYSKHYHTPNTRDYYKKKYEHEDMSEDTRCKSAMFLWLFLSFIF